MSTHNHLSTSGGSLLPSRLDRQVSRAIDQIDARAAIARRADQARIERITTTTAYGMGAAAHLVAVEASLAGVAPEGRDEVRAIRMAGTFGIANAVYQAGMGR